MLFSQAHLDLLAKPPVAVSVPRHGHPRALQPGSLTLLCSCQLLQGLQNTWELLGQMVLHPHTSCFCQDMDVEDGAGAHGGTELLWWLSTSIQQGDGEHKVLLDFSISKSHSIALK